MKKNLILLLALASTTVSLAQQKKPTTTKINTPTVQCEMCKDNIEGYLKGEDGIGAVKVDWKHKITTVTWFADRTNLENIKAAIANAGYDADDVKADPEAYKKLPKCCKKPEDGGGMKKQ
jgi:periplasmic mercuric ion binding protein